MQDYVTLTPARRRRRTGIPALFTVVASFIAVAMVGAASTTGFLSHKGGGVGNALDALVPASTVERSPATTPDEVPADSTTGAVDTEQATTTVVPTTAAPLADTNTVPTKDDPARLYIAGDSDAGNLGPPLERQVQDTGVVISKLFYKVSTGLSRPDFYDWPAKLKTDVESYHPDLVVVTFGGNDAQDLIINGVDYPVTAPQWAAEYGRRVGVVMDYLSADGRTLFWVGIPDASSATFNARLQILRDVTMAEAAKRPDVVYIDAWTRFTGIDGSYADYIVDPVTHQGVNVRASDGFHLNVAGAKILSYDVAAAIKKELIARGAPL